MAIANNKMKFKTLVITSLLLVLMPNLATSQQCSDSKRKPSWIDGYSNNLEKSYIQTTTGIGNTYDEALKKAIHNAIDNHSRFTEQLVKIEFKGNSYTVTGSDELRVKSMILDEYCERLGQNEYRVSIVTQTAKHPLFDLERAVASDLYPFSPRIFIPGMAQIYKGSTVKGVSFIVGEVILIAGIVVCEGQRASFNSKIKTTHNPTLRKSYIDDADQMLNFRNGFIAGASLLYAWNIIDGLAAKGQKNIFVYSHNNITLTPSGTGIVMNINF